MATYKYILPSASTKIHFHPIGDGIIEALECLKSWAREEAIFGAETEIGQVEKMLAELEQRTLDIKL